MVMLPGHITAFLHKPCSGDFQQSYSRTRPSLFRECVRTRTTLVFSAAKCAVPVAPRESRVKKVTSTREVPTLTQAFVPVACHYPHQESSCFNHLSLKE